MFFASITGGKDKFGTEIKFPLPLYHHTLEMNSTEVCGSEWEVIFPSKCDLTADGERNFDSEMEY